MDGHRKGLFLDKLNLLKAELSVLNKQIFSLQADEHGSDSELESIIDADDLYEDHIYFSISKLQEVDNGVISGGNTFSRDLPDKLKLPNVPLPTFADPKEESLEKFLHNFESIINKHVLSRYEKFIYLKNQLSGAPRTLVDSLDISKQSYDCAKDILCKAFGSTLTQKYDAIRKLSQIRLNSNGGDPYTYIGNMRSLTASFNNLKIDANTVLQYFFWHGLPDNFQNQLVHITNTNKPSLDQINENIFAATERYVKPNSSDKLNKRDSINKEPRLQVLKSSNFAVNVKTNSFKKTIACALCMADGKTNVTHPMKVCRVYNTPKMKADKLRRIRGCTTCSFINHKSGDCKFKFLSKCISCKGNHMTYLCMRSTPAAVNDSTANQIYSQETSNNTAWLQALHTT
jgi:hypothetical protein